EHEFAGKRFFRRLVQLNTEVEIIVHRIAESLLNLVNRLTLKGNHVAQTDNLAVEDFRFIVILDFTGISFVLHHGRIPPSCKKRRTDFTAPLSVSFCGWGW